MQNGLQTLVGLSGSTEAQQALPLPQSVSCWQETHLPSLHSSAPQWQSAFEQQSPV